MDKELINALVNFPLAILLCYMMWQNYHLAQKILSSYEVVIKELLNKICNEK